MRGTLFTIAIAVASAMSSVACAVAAGEPAPASPSPSPSPLREIGRVKVSYCEITRGQALSAVDGLLADDDQIAATAAALEKTRADADALQHQHEIIDLRLRAEQMKRTVTASAARSAQLRKLARSAPSDERKGELTALADALDRAVALQWAVAVRLNRLRNFIDSYGDPWDPTSYDRAEELIAKQATMNKASARATRDIQPSQTVLPSFDIVAHREGTHALPLVEAEIAKREGAIATAFAPAFQTCAASPPTGVSPPP